MLPSRSFSRRPFRHGSHEDACSWNRPASTSMRIASPKRSKNATGSIARAPSRRSCRRRTRTSSTRAISTPKRSSTKFAVSWPPRCRPERFRSSRRTKMNDRFYDFSKCCVRLMARVLWRARVYGAENVPADGPVIIACNHVSYLDPPVMGCLCPRRISYMAKKELFAVPLLGTAIRALGAYAVDRHGSATAAIKRSLQVLEAGGAVGIFPEGTRNRSGAVAPQTGVALLASLGRAPVVPVCIYGSDRALQLGRIDV